MTFRKIPVREKGAKTSGEEVIGNGEVLAAVDSVFIELPAVGVHRANIRQLRSGRKVDQVAAVTVRELKFLPFLLMVIGNERADQAFPCGRHLADRAVP